MKIAIIADSLDNQNAGVHQYTRSVINALANKENRIHEYILIRQKKEDDLPFHQIILKNISLPIGYASFRLFFLIPYIFRKHKVDAVFEPAHFGPFNLPKQVKRITMIHDLTPIKFPQFHRFHSRLLQQLFLPRILKKADLILSNSESTTNDIVEYQKDIERDKVSTILLGRDEFFTPDLEIAKIAKPSQKYFLFVGTIEPRKNLNTLLKAFEQVKSKTKSKVKLVIVGGMGWKNKSFFETLGNHPNKDDISLEGFVNKHTLRMYYTGALSLIYPSFYEGFGFPILEAMSCGTNVITSNISSMPEVGGEWAYYINPDNVEDLSELMIQKLNKEIGHTRGSLMKHASNFSWTKYADSFEKVISEL